MDKFCWRGKIAKWIDFTVYKNTFSYILDFNTDCKQSSNLEHSARNFTSRSVIAYCSQEIGSKQCQFFISDCHVLRRLHREAVWQTSLGRLA